ncbi:MAG: hypothetical protein JWN84_4494 [Nocardioides sp.]|jgi:hypothetical protein|nr:hypothetical protein [Nocardioides sp.]
MSQPLTGAARPPYGAIGCRLFGSVVGAPGPPRPMPLLWRGGLPDARLPQGDPRAALADAASLFSDEAAPAAAASAPVGTRRRTATPDDSDARPGSATLGTFSPARSRFGMSLTSCRESAVAQARGLRRRARELVPPRANAAGSLIAEWVEGVQKDSAGSDDEAGTQNRSRGARGRDQACPGPVFGRVRWLSRVGTAAERVVVGHRPSLCLSERLDVRLGTHRRYTMSASAATTQDLWHRDPNVSTELPHAVSDFR